MPVQINLGGLKIGTVDKGYVNIGPTLHAVSRARQHQNMGFGDIRGDGNYVENDALLYDNDLIDLPWSKETLHLPRGPR